MEEGDNILDVIYDDDNLDDDVDMIDVEEGELVEPNLQNVLEQSSAGDINEANQESYSENSKCGASKKKKNNKRKRKGSGPKVKNRQICVRYLSSSEREKVVYGIKPDTCYCFKEKPKLIFRTEKRERQSSNPLSPFPLQPQNETPPVFSANLSSINVYAVPSPSWHISLSSPAIIELMIVASVLFH